MSKELTKQEFRKKVFDGMCRSAENFRSMKGIQEIKKVTSFKPTPFKPTLSDKLIFNNLLDRVINNIWEDYYNEKFDNPTFDFIGFQVLCHYYYPDYSWWDKKELKDVR
ncbi:MAG: hypothetical protein WC812_02810 [Candidatus Pacearchaeota archaeon]|jgi:hypothetical protein